MIRARREVYRNRWVTLREKEVLFPWTSQVQEFYSLQVPDYVCVVPEMDDGRIILVRQYRPAVEDSCWEFPSGTREPGETPEETAHKELREETGFSCRDLFPLGKFSTDVGRLENFLYGFGARRLSPENFQPEPGLELRLVSPGELEEMIEEGVFNFALHLAIWEAFRRRRCRPPQP